MRQLLVLLFTAMLSPAIQVLPRYSTSIAGEAGWLSTLIALPVLLLLCWGLFRLLGPLGEGTGLDGAFERVLGRPLGKALTFLYFMWGLVALSANLRAYGQRFLTTSYRNVSLGGFIVIALAVVLWMARGKLSAFARTGEIFYLILCMVLGTVLFFALFNLEAKNVLPVWAEDLPAAAYAAIPALGTMGYGVFGAFLAGGVRRRRENRRRALWWAAALCILLTVLQFINIGNFGPGLVSRMEVPLFMMAKGIGVRGGFERVESVVVAIWALSDLVLAGLLVFACCAMAKSVFGLKQSRVAAAPVALLGGIGAFALFPDAFALSRFSETVLTMGNLILGFVVPLVVVLIAALRRKG